MPAVSLLLIRIDRLLVSFDQAHLLDPQDIAHWSVAGAKLSGSLVQRLELPTELTRFELCHLSQKCENWHQLRPSFEPTKYFELFDKLCKKPEIESSPAFKKIAQFFPQRGEKK